MASNGATNPTDNSTQPTRNTIVPNYLNSPVPILKTPFLTTKNTINHDNTETSNTKKDLEDLIDYGKCDITVPSTHNSH